MLNRTSRYKREEKEIQDRDEKAEQIRTINKLKEEVASLKDELLIQQEKEHEADKHAALLSRLYEEHIIDENGELLNDTK